MIRHQILGATSGVGVEVVLGEVEVKFHSVGVVAAPLKVEVGLHLVESVATLSGAEMGLHLVRSGVAYPLRGETLIPLG